MVKQYVGGPPPDQEEILSALHSLPIKKGPDGIVAEMLRRGKEICEEMTTRLITRIWVDEDVPTVLSHATICFLPKDNKNDSKNGTTYVAGARGT